MTMMRHTGRITGIGLALTVVLLSAACDASFPAAPGPASVEGVRLLVNSATNRQLQIGGAVSLTAYSVSADRVYANVTSTVTWVSSNPTAVRALSNSIFSVSVPGPIEFTALYQGFTDSITFDFVTPPPFEGSYPSLAFQSLNAPRIGTTSQARVRLARSATGTTEDVTDAASWASSNPGVATVERGRVTARGVGTVAISAAYDGVSTASYISVFPGF